jgi:hypothetical protein
MKIIENEIVKDVIDEHPGKQEISMEVIEV